MHKSLAILDEFTNLIHRNYYSQNLEVKNVLLFGIPIEVSMLYQLANLVTNEKIVDDAIFQYR